jgi:hypothetical protein
VVGVLDASMVRYFLIAFHLTLMMAAPAARAADLVIDGVLPSKNGGQGNFFEFDMPGVEGHDVVHDPDLRSGAIGDYLNSLSEEH